MQHVGYAVAPADAHRSVLSTVDLVLTRNGGRGAVRELAELLLSHAGTEGFQVPPQEVSAGEEQSFEDHCSHVRRLCRRFGYRNCACERRFKGHPGKNLASLGGRSLLQRAIEACQEAASVKLCVVSTDDAAIGRVAETLGAHVVWRPESLAGDSATSESAVLHALERIESTGIALPPFGIMVQCTSPFLFSTDLDAVTHALAEGGADSCFTASRSHRFLWRIDPEGQAFAVNHDPGVRLPRQELDPEYVETGAAYGFTVDGFRLNRKRFFGRVMIAETDSWRTLEIDDQFDLDLARALSVQVGLSMRFRIGSPDRAGDAGLPLIWHAV